jgi:hypothetical protein
MGIMVKLILLCGLSACAYSSPLLITGGTFGLSDFGVSFSFVGDGFSAQGSDDAFPVHCGFCSAPFQLVNPMPFTLPALNGHITLGGNSYILPDAGFNGGSPWASGSVFLSPQGTLPMVAGAGTYNVPFNVGGSFCVTDNPQVPPPTPPSPSCFSVLGTAIAHYTVSATGTPNTFFQPLPTIEIVPAPEPGTLSAGMLGIVLMLAAKYRPKAHTS